MAHLGGSNASLRLQCARAQAYTGDEGSTCVHRPLRMPGDLHILQNTHTHTHAASTHLGCGSRGEAAHLDGSNAFLRLRCTRVQAYTGDERSTQPVRMPSDLPILLAHILSNAHLNCSSRVEAGHLGDSHASLRLQGVCTVVHK